MARATITVRIERYAYPRGTTDYKVPATLVGDLAVHRPVFWHDGDTPHASGKGWTVTHHATGLGLGTALGNSRPEDWTRAKLVQWAERLQQAVPDFFTAIREGGAVVDNARAMALIPTVKAEGRRLAGELLS